MVVARQPQSQGPKDYFSLDAGDHLVQYKQNGAAHLSVKTLRSDVYREPVAKWLTLRACTPEYTGSTPVRLSSTREFYHAQRSPRKGSLVSLTE